ncbi:PREDICTED: acidic leucine-rich nuclear phosphoprotein 32 family member A-like [Ipomoea nil]|uniref:acidic leucine-rich nuclear phosphoprotein 32 family member A-like n=1 Tax=Ipomoea nil TaxID=35883 RepID=UPI000901C283|nr:PREDICTED: acidic leucine-rich nuclear phosphoprotein 32 family member A-like [Ipomoea nil]
MPSLHETTVKRSLAELLYKIGKGIQVNIGNIVYSQITNLAESSESKASLFFPNLIHAILSKQGLKTHGPKTQVKTINTTKKLKKGSHQNYLKASFPTDNPTDQQTLIKYFEKRSKELDDAEKQLLRKHMEIKEEKVEVLQWLKALKTERNEENSDDDEEEKTENEEGDQENDEEENEEEDNEEEDGQAEHGETST